MQVKVGADFRLGTLESMTDGAQIGEMAERHDVTPATLRYYEEIGLLPVPARTVSGYRIYGDSHDQRLRFIGRAKDLDLSLDEISVLLEVWETGDCHDTRQQLRHTVAHKVADARRRACEALVAAEQLTHVYNQLSRPASSPGDADSGCGCVPELPADPATDFEDELWGVQGGICSCRPSLIVPEDGLDPETGDGCRCCSPSFAAVT